jgi:hypothetical protein
VAPLGGPPGGAPLSRLCASWLFYCSGFHASSCGCVVGWQRAYKQTTLPWACCVGRTDDWCHSSGVGCLCRFLMTKQALGCVAANLCVKGRSSVEGFNGLTVGYFICMVGQRDSTIFGRQSTRASYVKNVQGYMSFGRQSGLRFACVSLLSVCVAFGSRTRWRKESVCNRW